MNLDLNRVIEKVGQNEFVKEFIKELGEYLEMKNNKKMENIELTPEEDLDFYRKKSDFLQEYFKNELSDLKNGEIFMVTDKFENDSEYHRYKVAQYKNDKECKYIAFEKDLPEDIKIGDMVRRVDGKYLLDEQATEFVNDSINNIMNEIIKNRQ